MTVAVSLNLSDGVILGVDSAVTITHASGKGILKVYENAQKLFQLAEKPVGLATFGMGGIGARSIGSYVREFEILDPNNVVTKPSSMKDTVEELRSFFLKKYHSLVVPQIEAQTKKKFKEIPRNQKPVLGFAVGGFSHGEYLSEVWEVIIPFHQTTNSATRLRKQGEFGGNWFALNEPIFRYVKGYDRRLLNELKNYFKQVRGSNFTRQEELAITKILQKYEYPTPFIAMPLEEGVAHVKFLVEMVVHHHRFTIGAPIVGGKVHIGLVTYKGEKFQIIQ